MGSNLQSQYFSSYIRKSAPYYWWLPWMLILHYICNNISLMQFLPHHIVTLCHKALPPYLVLWVELCSFKWQFTPVFLPWESYGQRSPWGHKESDITEWLTHTHTHNPYWASLVSQVVKNLPAVWETWIQPLGWKSLWRRERLPTPVFWPVECHGLYSPLNQLSDFHFTS